MPTFGRESLFACFRTQTVTESERCIFKSSFSVALSNSFPCFSNKKTKHANAPNVMISSCGKFEMTSHSFFFDRLFTLSGIWRVVRLVLGEELKKNTLSGDIHQKRDGITSKLSNSNGILEDQNSLRQLGVGVDAQRLITTSQI